MAEGKAKERAAKGIGVITPLLGLGAQIGTAAQTLKKRPKVDVNVPGYDATAVPLGIAAQGHGMGRGPATLAAFRAAGTSGQRLAGVRANAQFQADQINTTNEIDRRQAIGAFGADLASGLGLMGSGLVEAANARTAEREAAALKNQQETAQALPQPDGMQLQDPSGMNIYENQPSAAEMAQNPYALQSSVIHPLMNQVQEMVQSEIRNKSEALTQARASLGIPDLELQMRVAPEMEEMASRFNVMLDLIDKEGLDMTLALPQLARMMGTNSLEMLNPPIRLLNEELNMDGGNDG